MTFTQINPNAVLRKYEDKYRSDYNENHIHDDESERLAHLCKYPESFFSLTGVVNPCTIKPETNNIIGIDMNNILTTKCEKENPQHIPIYYNSDTRKSSSQNTENTSYIHICDKITSIEGDNHIISNEIKVPTKKIKNALYGDQLKRILTKETTKGKTKVYHTAVDILIYMHNLEKDKQPYNFHFSYQKAAKNLDDISTRTISRACKYLENMSVISIDGRLAKNSKTGVLFTMNHIKINYDVLLKLYIGNGMTVPIFLHSLCISSLVINNLTTDLYVDLVAKKEYEYSQPENNTDTSETPVNKAQDDGKDLLTPIRQKCPPISCSKTIKKKDIFIINGDKKNNDDKRKIKLNPDTKNIPKTKRLWKPQRPLAWFIPYQDSILKAMQRLGNIDIKPEDVKQIMNSLANKSKLKFILVKDVAKYFLPTFITQQSSKQSDNRQYYDKPKLISEIVFTQDMLDLINTSSGRDINLFGANKILKNIRKNPKYAATEFTNEQAFVNYMIKAFGGELNSDEVLKMTKEERAQWNRVLIKRDKPTGGDHDAEIVNKLTFTLPTSKMCQFLDEARIHYNDDYKKCTVYLKKEDSTLETDHEFRNALLSVLEMMFGYQSDGNGFEINFKPSTSNESTVAGMISPSVAVNSSHSDLCGAVVEESDQPTNLPYSDQDTQEPCSDKLTYNGYTILGYDKIWEFLNHQILADRIGKDAQMWSKTLKIIVSNDGKILKLLAASTFMQKWTTDHYYNEIEQSLNAMFGKEYTFGGVICDYHNF